MNDRVAEDRVLKYFEPLDKKFAAGHEAPRY